MGGGFARRVVRSRALRPYLAPRRWSRSQLRAIFAAMKSKGRMMEVAYAARHKAVAPLMLARGAVQRYIDIKGPLRLNAQHVRKEVDFLIEHASKAGTRKLATMYTAKVRDIRQRVQDRYLTGQTDRRVRELGRNITRKLFDTEHLGDIRSPGLATDTTTRARTLWAQRLDAERNISRFLREHGVNLGRPGTPSKGIRIPARFADQYRALRKRAGRDYVGLNADAGALLGRTTPVHNTPSQAAKQLYAHKKVAADLSKNAEEIAKDAFAQNVATAKLVEAPKVRGRVRGKYASVQKLDMILPTERQITKQESISAAKIATNRAARTSRRTLRRSTKPALTTMRETSPGSAFGRAYTRADLENVSLLSGQQQFNKRTARQKSMARISGMKQSPWTSRYTPKQIEELQTWLKNNPWYE